MKGLSLLVTTEAWVEAKTPQGDRPPAAAGTVSLLGPGPPPPVLRTKGTVSAMSAWLSWEWGPLRGLPMGAQHSPARWEKPQDTP